MSDSWDTTFLLQNYEFCAKPTTSTTAWISGAVILLTTCANHSRDTSSTSLTRSCSVTGMGTFSLQSKPNFPLSAGSLFFVVRAYEAQKADELSLNNGVVVEVVRKSDNGWWLIR